MLLQIIIIIIIIIIFKCQVTYCSRSRWMYILCLDQYKHC